MLEEDFEKLIIPMLSGGAVGILPTDTLYGIVASALRKESVERIYKLRKRELDKPLIVLISSIDDLKLFSIEISFEQKKFLEELWPAKLSVVFDCPDGKFEYLTRGGKTLALRIPADDQLRKILEKTGPLVAPSANISGMEPARTIDQAKKYFGDEIDFYVDGGELNFVPSTLIQFDKFGNIKVLREGAVKIRQN